MGESGEDDPSQNMKQKHFNVGPTPGNPVSTGRTTLEAMKALRRFWEMSPVTKVKPSKKTYRRDNRPTVE